MDTVIRDLRLALRGLRRTPGFALTAVLTLALGVGLSTAVFTVADALLLRRLPVRDQGRLLTLWGETADRGVLNYPITPAAAREFARTSRTLTRAAFFTREGAQPNAVRDAGRLSRLNRSRVSGEFFEVLGVRAALGRTLRAEDDREGSAPVVVLSWGEWHRRFGGDTAVLGRRLVMHADGVGYTIVGVMPQGLDFPRGTEIWVPAFASLSEQALMATELDIVARLAPGATAAAARDELTRFFRRPGASAWQRTLHAVATPLPELILGETRPALFAFAAASALLLLLTCINVANLLLVRGLARVREVAVRAALGAGRARIVAQLLAENAGLAVAGGALGVAVADGAVRLFVAFAPPGVPRLDEVGLNATAFAGAAGITGLAMLLFALAPALMTSRVELQEVLRSGARGSAGRHSRRVTEVLVVGQVALALVVLSAAGLIARSLLRLQGVNLSFTSSRLLVGELALRASMFDDKAKQVALLERIGEQLAAVPGVRAWSPVVAAPFSGVGGWDGSLASDGQTAQEAAANPMLNIDLVGPGYFEALGLPMIEGRGFTGADREGAPSVIVVSETTARHYWPGQDPIGKRLGLGSSLEQAGTVVGVVPDTRYRDLRTARPSIYYALRQSFFPFAPTDLVIRTSGPPGDLVPAIRRAVEAASSGVVLANVAPFDAFLDAPLAQPRLNAVLLGVFALAAVALAAVGLFGVMATMVRQRAHELGVRMALGATAADLRRMLMGRGLAIAVAGTAIGLLGAMLANRLLAGMLFEVSPTDGLTLALVSGLLLVVAALASLVPARSGTRIDPVIALRSEG